jgi:hemerythrin-like metal-binding protein
MSLFVWDAHYSVGIGEIDRQHQKLFVLFNELYDAMQQGHGNDVVGNVLASVVDYTAYHFAHEEELFRRYGYPDEAAHRAEHAKLTDQAKTLEQRLRAGHSEVTMVTLKFLCDWLTNHIMGADKKFAPFLTDKGVR